MKIPRTLPQFTNKTALFVITGRLTGKFILARDGQTSALGDVAVDKPKYSDNEGFFESSGHGRILRSGAVREINEQELAKRFLRETVKRVRQAITQHEVTHLYLFTPRDHELKNALRRRARKLLRQTFHGSYLNASLKKLLEMIKTRRTARVVKPLSAEAQKLLSKAKRRP